MRVAAHYNLRVEVYYNLHKKVFSVRALEGYKKGLVIKHLNSVYIEYPTFVVQEGGRQRVIRENRKNVHAFVRGSLVGCEHWPIPDKSKMEQVTYNPYKYNSFVMKSDETRVDNAPYAFLENRSIWCPKRKG